MAIHRFKTVLTVSKSLFSIWLKSTSKLGWPSGGSQLDLREKNGLLLKDSNGSFQKCHLTLTRRQNSSKSSLNSGSLIFLWIGTVSNLFSSTLISASDRTLWLRLKIVPEQSCPLKCPKLVKLTWGSLAISTLSNSYKISNN